MWINGSGHPGSGDGREIVNPGTGATLDTTVDGTGDDVAAAVEAAAAAAPEWAATDTTKRAKILHAVADALQEQSSDIVATLVAEQGKPTLEANGEFHHMLAGLRYYADAATKVRGTYQDLPSQFGPAYGLILRRPFGVVGAIIPWNFPLTLLANKLGPALAAGNTVVAKPSETTPLSTLKVAQIATEAGLPDGVFNVVTGAGATGQALVGHPEVRRIAFTGSTATGQKLMETAGPMLKHVSLELGGSDPTIVLPDADLDGAIKNIQIGRYWNAGQVCLAPKRAFVHADVFDEFVEKLSSRIQRYEPGDGTTKPDKPHLRIGPMHTAAQRDLLVEQVADATDAGAEMVTGGHVVDGSSEGDGHFYQPGLAVNVPTDSRLATEEVFGPVLPVWSIDSLDEAIERANDTQFGLGSSIWTTDAAAIQRAVNDIDAGITWVNQLHYGYDEMPFGGTKMSGLGKEHGLEALAEYSELKSSVVGGLA